MTNKTATIVVDLGFGDAGKGTMIDFLARKGSVAAVVRFNGGSQAAHNVVTPDGRHHTFSQFGSGSFVPGVRTHLSRHMLFDPEQLLIEAYELMRQGVRDPCARLTVDEDAPVVTPYHISANVIREHLRGANRDGTCGRGIGETMLHLLTMPDDAIRVRDLKEPVVLLRKARNIQEHFSELFRTRLGDITGRVRTEHVPVLSDPTSAQRWARDTTESLAHLQVVGGEHLATLSRSGTLLFEGAQGVLLDEWHGFHPHTTWSKTNTDNALSLLSEIGYEGRVTKMGVLRSYFTRHGEGPLPTEDTSLGIPELHNGEQGWQGRFRRGWFDAVLAKYALEATGGIDMLALTHLDAVPMLQKHSAGQMPVSVGYYYDSGPHAKGLVERLEVAPRGGPLDYRDCHTGFLMGAAEPCWDMQQYAGEHAYAHTIADMLGVRLGMVSCGPTAADKHVL